MPTSSIFTSINIEDPETAERFVAALEASEQQSKNMPRAHVARLVTDENEVRELALKMERRYGISS